jgi:hypothetical protein
MTYWRSARVITIIVFNALIALYAIYNEWRILDLFIIMILELFVVGLFNVPKIILSQKGQYYEKVPSMPKKIGYSIWFFIRHLLLIIAFAFVVQTQFGVYEGSRIDERISGFTISRADILYSLIAILIISIVVYIYGFIRKKEFEHISMKDQVNQPYKGLLLPLILLIGQGNLLVKLTEPFVLIIAFFVVKEMGEIYAFKNQREKEEKNKLDYRKKN